MLRLLLLRVRKHTQNNYCLVLVVCFFLLIGFTFSLNESLARTLPFYIYIYILVMYNYRASWECVRLVDGPRATLSPVLAATFILSHRRLWPPHRITYASPFRPRSRSGCRRCC